MGLVFVFGIVNRVRRVGRPGALVDADRAVAALLEHANQLEADHLQHRQERDDHVGAGRVGVEQILEAAGFGFRQPLEQLLDARLDRNLFGRQRHRRPLAGALEHLLERRQQAEEIDFDLGLVVVAGDLLDARIGPAPLRAAQRFLVVQQLGGGLELLVLEQAADQRVARIFLVRRIAGRGLGPRQQHLALDVDQRRRHHQELAGDVEVQLLHQVQVLEVLPGDDRDLDVVDVHLVLLDQMNEQIERPFEGLQLDLDRLELRLEDFFVRHLIGRCCAAGGLFWSVGHQYFSFTASRTRSMVWRATPCAFFEPSISTSRM